MCLSTTVPLCPNCDIIFERMQMLTDGLEGSERIVGMQLSGLTLDTRGSKAPHDNKGNKSKTPIFTEDYNKALTFAEYDIKSNWKMYKEAFLGGAE